VVGCCECGDEPSGSCATELVLGYLQGLHNAESEIECEIGSDHNTECVAAESQNKKFTHCGFLLKQAFDCFFIYCIIT
jgi:hypothetical protein